MKYKLNLSKEELLSFTYFSLGLLVLLEIFFYRSGFFNILIISLKLSFLVHLFGYLLALRLFKEEFDRIALLFLGLAFGLISMALFYYLPSLFDVNINSITYIVPLVLLAIGLGLSVKKEEEKKEEHHPVPESIQNTTF